MTLTTSTAVAGVRATCLGIFCRLMLVRCLQRQHDRADHGDQKDEAGDLEEVDVVRIEHVAESGRIGALGDGRDRHGDGLGDFGRDHAAADDDDQFGRKDQADQRADRRIFEDARPQFGEVDVEHHDDEEEENRDRADIDDEQDHRQELGAESAGTGPRR